MDLRRLIGSEKSSVKTGEWKRGEIPRSAWPSRKARAKAYKYGPLYQWRIITFAAGGYDCRVLLLFNESKQIFRATFGVVLAGDTVAICDYEYHASEPGWHCHARCGELATINTAMNRFGGVRLPHANANHRRKEFSFRKSPLTVVSAFNFALSTFKLDKVEGLL